MMRGVVNNIVARVYGVIFYVSFFEIYYEKYLEYLLIVRRIRGSVMSFRCKILRFYICPLLYFAY
jgi:hypothetical protein